MNTEKEWINNTNGTWSLVETTRERRRRSGSASASAMSSGSVIRMQETTLETITKKEYFKRKLAGIT